MKYELITHYIPKIEAFITEYLSIFEVELLSVIPSEEFNKMEILFNLKYNNKIFDTRVIWNSQINKYNEMSYKRLQVVLDCIIGNIKGTLNRHGVI